MRTIKFKRTLSAATAAIMALSVLTGTAPGTIGKLIGDIGLTASAEGDDTNPAESTGNDGTEQDTSEEDSDTAPDENAAKITEVALKKGNDKVEITTDTAGNHKATVTYGDTDVVFTATAADGGNITYTSSTDTVATISNDGAVTILKTGGAIITATATYGDGATETYKLVLTVEKKKISAPTPADTLTYNGEKQTMNFDGAGNDIVSRITGNAYTDAGEYLATFKLKDEANTEWKIEDTNIPGGSVAWKINPKVVNTCVAEVIKDQTYTGSAIEPQVVIKESNAEDAAVIDPSNYKITWSNNTNVGTATGTVTFNSEKQVDEKKNYAGSTMADGSNPTFTIVAADIDPAPVVAANNATIALGSNKPLLTVENADHCTIKYSIGENAPQNWEKVTETTIPTANNEAITEKGTVKVWYKIIPNDNYKLADGTEAVGSVDVEIAKAASVLNSTVSANSNLVYTGEQMELVDVAEGETEDTGTIEYVVQDISSMTDAEISALTTPPEDAEWIGNAEATDAGKYRVWYRAGATDDTSASDAEHVDVTIERVTLTSDADPLMMTIPYGTQFEKAESSTIDVSNVKFKSGETEVEVEGEWEIKTFSRAGIPDVGDASLGGTVDFIPTNTNYKPVKFTFKVTVTPADISKKAVTPISDIPVGNDFELPTDVKITDLAIADFNTTGVLVKGKDYEINGPSDSGKVYYYTKDGDTYSQVNETIDKTKAATYYINVTGKGNYTGTIYVPFNLVKVEPADFTPTAKDAKGNNLEIVSEKENGKETLNVNVVRNLASDAENYIQFGSKNATLGANVTYALEGSVAGVTADENGKFTFDGDVTSFVVEATVTPEKDDVAHKAVKKVITVNVAKPSFTSFRTTIKDSSNAELVQVAGNVEGINYRGVKIAESNNTVTFNTTTDLSDSEVSYVLVDEQDADGFPLTDDQKSSLSSPYNTAGAEAGSEPGTFTFTKAGQFLVGVKAAKAGYSEPTALYMVVVTEETPVADPTVTFNMNGKGENKSVVVKKGTTVQMPESPTATGYTFEGWYTDPECTSKFGNTTLITEDTTLYAKWKAKDITVTFNNENGNDPEPRTTQFGKKLTAPEEPTNSNNDIVFVGWYNGNELFDFNEPVTNVTADGEGNLSLTLTAKWAKKIVATVASNGGSGTDSSVTMNGAAVEGAENIASAFTGSGGSVDLQGAELKIKSDTNGVTPDEQTAFEDALRSEMKANEEVKPLIAFDIAVMNGNDEQNVTTNNAIRISVRLERELGNEYLGKSLFAMHQKGGRIGANDIERFKASYDGKKTISFDILKGSSLSPFTLVAVVEKGTDTPTTPGSHGTVAYEKVTDGGITYHVYSDHAEVAEVDTATETAVIKDKVGGENVTAIAENAFNSCKQLTEVKIPDSVTEIDANAFWGCKALAEITIPESVTKIDKNAFSHCSALTTINGVAGSAAEAFAQANGYTFKDTSTPGTPETPDADKLTATNVAIDKNGKVTWDAAEDAAEYKVFKKIGGKIYNTGWITKTEFTFDSVPTVNFEVYVASRNAGKSAVKYSEHVAVTGAMPLGTAANVKVTDAGKVTWTAAANAKYYKVVKEVNGTSYSKIVKSGTSTTISVPSGSYKVWVEAIGQYDTKTVSEVKDVTVKNALGYINEVKVDKNGKVTWTAAQGAVEYKVAKVVDGKTYYSSKLTDTSFTFKSVPKKDYQVFVVAFDKDGKTAWGKKNLVEVGNLGTVLDPKVDANGKVTWTAARNAVKYKVGKTVNGKTYYTGELTTNSATIKVPKSDYKVFVVAFDKEGNKTWGTKAEVKVK